MPNPNPKTEQLALGRGKRPKLNNETVCMRMSQATRSAIEEIAYSYGCIYGGKPWPAGLLEKVGSGELLVVPAPPPRVEIPQQPLDPRQTIKTRLQKRLHSSSGKSAKE